MQTFPKFINLLEHNLNHLTSTPSDDYTSDILALALLLEPECIPRNFIEAMKTARDIFHIFVLSLDDRLDGNGIEAASWMRFSDHSITTIYEEFPKIDKLPAFVQLLPIFQGEVDSD